MGRDQLPKGPAAGYPGENEKGDVERPAGGRRLEGRPASETVLRPPGTGGIAGTGGKRVEVCLDQKTRRCCY